MRCFDDTTTPRHVRKRDVMKSPVQENCTPGSVRGAPGNRRPYLDRCLTKKDSIAERACPGLGIVDSSHQRPPDSYGSGT